MATRVDANGGLVLVSTSERYHVNTDGLNYGGDVTVDDENGLQVATLTDGTDAEGRLLQMQTAEVLAAAPELRDCLRALLGWARAELDGRLDPEPVADAAAALGRLDAQLADRADCGKVNELNACGQCGACERLAEQKEG